MENITSKSNSKVKFIKSLNEKKFRQQYNMYYLEGIKVVNELLDIYSNQAIEIDSIACSIDKLKTLKNGNEIIERLSKIENIEVYNIDYDIFKNIVDTKTPQGVLAVIKIKKSILDNNSNIIILDRLQDSGNVGTIIRTAKAFNVNNIICIEGTTDVYSPKVLRSTMSSIFKINIITIKNDELQKEILKIKEKGYNLIGTSLKCSEFVKKEDFNKKVAIVIGNEANGMSEQMHELCDKLIKIPINSEIESLNASVCASILLYLQY